MEKKTYTKWQIWNMSVGLLGINFGWGLQMANMSAIYEFLGAAPDQIPILWLAAPLTGLLVQPLVGWYSDRTWCSLGRRRPYFLVGAIIATCALILMPLSSSLWMAATLLWILDATINVSMGPFRALLPDLLSVDQLPTGYRVQSILIAAGTVLASAMPWVLQHALGMTENTGAHTVSRLVMYSFWMGAVMLMISILWTVFTTREFPPTTSSGASMHWKKVMTHLLQDFREMPTTMKDLAWVVMTSWMGLFCMFLYFPIALVHRVFHGMPGTEAYAHGLAWGGLCFAVHGVFFFIASLFMPVVARFFSNKAIYSFSLMCGGLALMAMFFDLNKWQAMALMIGVGFAFASMQTIPYILLAQALPANKLGTYMGLFNLFIVIPEIIISLGFGWVMNHFLDGQRHLAVVCGGFFMLLAAMLVWRVQSSASIKCTTTEPCFN